MIQKCCGSLRRWCLLTVARLPSTRRWRNRAAQPEILRRSRNIRWSAMKASALPNHTVKLLGPIDRLPGVVVVGNPKGKETLIEFYDLNCPFCRMAAADLGDMLKPRSSNCGSCWCRIRCWALPRSAPPASSSRWRNWARPSNSMNFIARSMRSAARPTARARSRSPAGLGLNKQNLLALGDSDQITDTMKNLVNLGTFARVWSPRPPSSSAIVAILGYPGPHALQAIVAAAGTCGKVAC